MTTMTMRVTSHSMRPLRQPLSSTNNTHSSRQHDHGKVTLKRHVGGGSLPIFPTAGQQQEAVRSTSSSLSRGRERLGLYSVSDETRDSAPAAPARATHNLPKETITSHGTTNVSLSKKKRSLPQDAPGREPHRSASGGAVVEKNTRRQRKPKQQQVRFHTVRVSYYDNSYELSQSLETMNDSDYSMTMELDAYERQRGPPRPRRFFIKSPSELRRSRRWRQIQDSIADDEWKAIRQQQHEQQIASQQQQASKSHDSADELETTLVAPSTIEERSVKPKTEPVETNGCGLFKKNHRLTFLCGRRRS